MTQHRKWAELPTEEIEKYLDKYRNEAAPGKCSSRRRKKIRFFQTTLNKREQAIRLLTQRF